VVTAVETHYYWPDLRSDFREILRVLKPGGRFIIVAEAYRGRRFDWIYAPAMRVLGGTYMTLAQHRKLMTGAGFQSVDVIPHPKGWMCAVGDKPT
jgi:SAM-dependent methyltransferase